MNWREACEATTDMDYRSDILRAILKRKPTAQDITWIVDMMETLPMHLQSYIAADVIYMPQTTLEIFERVKCNPGLLAVTTPENIQSMWNRNHACVSSI